MLSATMSERAAPAATTHLHVVRTHVLVLQIVRVLPHVDADQRRLGARRRHTSDGRTRRQRRQQTKRTSLPSIETGSCAPTSAARVLAAACADLVGARDDAHVARRRVVDEPRPAAALHADGARGELFREARKRAKLCASASASDRTSSSNCATFVDRLRQRADSGAAAAGVLGREVLPEQRVIHMAAAWRREAINNRGALLFLQSSTSRPLNLSADCSEIALAMSPAARAASRLSDAAAAHEPNAQMPTKRVNADGGGVGADKSAVQPLVVDVRHHRRLTVVVVDVCLVMLGVVDLHDLAAVGGKRTNDGNE